MARAIYEAVPDPSVLTDDVNNSGGVAPQSQRITISDFPDSYEIVFLVPTSQTVKVILTWNTAGRNFIDPASIASLAVPAIERYINAIYVGEPVNIYQLQSVFQQSISSILSTGQLSLIKVSVAIDGKVVEPDKNTGLIQSDYYKYLVTNQASISVQKYDGKN